MVIPSRCCCGGCRLCAGTSEVPDYLTLILSGAVDFDCAVADAACDNEPSPLSPFASINGEHQLDYSASLTAANAGGNPCIRWYESEPFAYGDFLASTVGAPDCIVASGYTITFAAEVVYVSGPDVLAVYLYTYIMTDEGVRYYSGITSTVEADDMAWLCDSELTSDEWTNPGYDFYATTGDGYPDAYLVRFNLGDCADEVVANPVAIQMSRSAGGFTP